MKKYLLMVSLVAAVLLNLTGIAAAGDAEVKLSSSDGSTKFEVKDSGGTAQTSIDSDGHAVLSGGVKVGNDSSAAGSSKAGTIRWTGTQLEWCDGTKWCPFKAKNPAKLPSSTYQSATAIATAGWDEGNGLYYINPGGSLGASVQVYCDFTTEDMNGDAGWMLVASFATDYLWTSSHPTSNEVFSSTALTKYSSNFGNFTVKDFRIHAAPLIDSGGASSSGDWYYHMNTGVAWKQWWAETSGSAGLYLNDSTYNPSNRDGLRGFDYSYNLKFSYQNTAHKSNGLSDDPGTGDFWTALTTSGQTININGIASDGSFCWSPTLANTGQDVGSVQSAVGIDDSASMAYYGPAYNSTGGGNGAGGTTQTTNLWLWVK